MTVSPEWAQDGSHLQEDGDNGVQMDSNPRQDALPPTLFKLPSLRGQTELPSTADDEIQPPAPPAVSAAIQTPATTVAPPQAPAARQDKSSHVSNSSFEPSVSDAADGRSTPNDRQIPSESRAQETRSSHIGFDQPAGRSWMESVRSHGVVVVLLLIVVVAALVTSTSSTTSNTDDSFAENQDLLNIDVGTEVTLPLPTHGHAETTVAVSGDEAATEAGKVDPFKSPQVSAEKPSVSEVAEVANSASKEFMASLDPPTTSLTTTPDQDLPIDSVPMLNSTSSVDALPASSRTPSESGDVGLPSLDDLQEPATPGSSVAGVGTIAKEADETIIRKSTNTPTGISDLLRHLQDLTDGK
ncbi:MAG: hypothetical protein AB8B91_25050 [Rubripirellula sp.]